MVKLRELEAFDAYMRHGGMQKAAVSMGLRQPMVSRLLTSLEERVGFELFIRSRNRLTPTPEAFQYHIAVVRTLASFRHIREEAVAIANKQVGNLVVAAQPIFCDTFLLDLVARFNLNHPKVNVRIIDAGMEEISRMISDHSCDLALGITLNGDLFGASVTPLARCEAVCIMPADHPLTHENVVFFPQLLNEKFVELAPGSPLRTRVDYLMQDVELKRNIVAEMRHLRGVVNLVERGLGVAIVDPVACQLINAQKIVTRPLFPKIHWDIAQFIPKEYKLSRLGKAFSDEIALEIAHLKGSGIIL
ncbi:LysR family transcriptional regulator [Cohaesibacter celericrescens]|uniref:LysR family transcriptional regulator n=1 Tax=Cohaesibacter celericrescens TaxID=2067669 RepID=A0A2N5XT67_9HYPH|nr:LysR family transcriptional regulator [Cohaesibacter celericrescens]PLW77618.1 LysR family transcriptional regulator [Cohaesibacter celericrescens]